jgi:FkbM family methyltransferase
MTCLDVGARGGFTHDLLAIGAAVDACGFEPDPDECQRLNRIAAAQPHPWRSLRFVPVALGREACSQTLHLYRRRGCSSLLEADVQLAGQFARAEYYQLDDRVALPVVPLDAAAAIYHLENAAYLKIDIQGLELEVLESAPRLVDHSLLVIRAEVSFLPLYKRQPTFADLDRYFRPRGFLVMGFPELHHWRRTTRTSHGRLARGPIPFSRGQLVHGDALYFRDPATLADDTARGVQLLLQAAFLALAYGYVDHAAAICARPTVARYIQAVFGFDIQAAFHQASRTLARRHRGAQWRQFWRDAGRLLRGDLTGH